MTVYRFRIMIQRSLSYSCGGWYEMNKTKEAEKHKMFGGERVDPLCFWFKVTRGNIRRKT